MKASYSRREFLGTMGLATGAWVAPSVLAQSQAAPAGTVVVGMCAEYSRNVLDVLAIMFDQLGGLETLVRGKTVAIKLNRTGTATDRLYYLAPEMTHWIHPQVIWATVHLLGKAGATRIRLLESPWSTAEPLEDFLVYAGWNPDVRQYACSCRTTRRGNTRSESDRSYRHAPCKSPFPVPSALQNNDLGREIAQHVRHLTSHGKQACSG